MLFRSCSQHHVRGSDRGAAQPHRHLPADWPRPHARCRGYTRTAKCSGRAPWSAAALLERRPHGRDREHGRVWGRPPQVALHARRAHLAGRARQRPLLHQQLLAVPALGRRGRTQGQDVQDQAQYVAADIVKMT